MPLLNEIVNLLDWDYEQNTEVTLLLTFLVHSSEKIQDIQGLKNVP